MALQEEMEKQGQWLFRYRSYLPLIILTAALLLFYLKTANGIQAVGLEKTRIQTLAFIVSMLGLGIRIFTVGHTPKNTSGRNTKEGQVADSLNTSGIYSTVRHPLYVGNYLMWLGPAILTESWSFCMIFTLCYWLYYERIMYAEEQFLRHKFGTAYLNWSEKTPAFIPNIRQYQSNIYNFNVRKVLLKEKNSILATFLIFSVFDYLSNLNLFEKSYNKFFIYGTISSCMFYVSIKVLKKFTEFFNSTDV